jgi:hypothetical protein
MPMSTDIVLIGANLGGGPCVMTRKEFAMKYNPYEDEQVGERRIGRPPLPADAIYRLRQQHGEMFDELDDLEPIGNPKVNDAPTDVGAEQPPPVLTAEIGGQAGDDEDAYHPITPNPPKQPKP